MCGICGILHPKGDEGQRQESIVREMMNELIHRGPDGEGLSRGPGFSFGHRRLAIIDLDRGSQPMVSADGRYVLSFNGEIYNYLELRNSLLQKGVSFSTFSDTEVLLQMLICKGTGALSEIIGMFSFSFIDQKTGEWLLARDHFGIKPLYYTTTGEEIVFASEIKAILKHPGVTPAVNDDAIGQYMTMQFCLHGATLFDGISALRPGHFMKGKHNKVKKTVCYWDTNYVIDEHHTEAFFRDKLLSLLEDSARLQIRSDVPLGAYLSGGLDSSIIACMASEHVEAQHLPVFHGRFAEGVQYDESSYARAICEHIDGEYFEVVPTAADFVETMPLLIRAMDEPVAGPGLFPQYMVSSMASKEVKVVLGGQGGDEIFGGYARYLVGYLEQALKGAINETQEEGVHIVTLQSIIPNLPVLKQYIPLMQHFFADGLFDSMDARYFRLIDRSASTFNILTAEARDSINQESVYEEFKKVFNHADTRSYINKMTHFDQKTLLPALLQVEDRVSMAVSLESRVPLLDHRIVDLVTTMPPPVKFKGGQTKYILREAIGNVLPPVALQRKDKMGFPVPLTEWLKGGVVRDFVSDVLLSKKCRERGIFNAAELQRLISEEQTFGRQLWGALSLELWHREMIDS